MKDYTFEQAMSRLDEIVELLSSGKAPLEQSLELYAESAKLMAFCNQTLKQARLTIEEIFPEGEGENEE